MRSREAQALEAEIRKRGGRLKSEEQSRAFYLHQLQAEDAPFPEEILKGTGARLTEFEGSPLVVCGDEAAERCVIYVHGGAFALEMNDLHVKFCIRLAERTGACFYLPVYPLTPKHHYDEAYALIDALYGKVQDRTIAFMGDSSGGGFVLAYAQQLRGAGKELPGQIIVLSPWVDLSMSSSDYAPYDPKDPMLGVPGLIMAGEYWANGLDTKDPKLSAMFGDNRGLPPVTVFAGTAELLYPDVILYAEKLRRDGVPTELIVGEDMNHMYPLFPIPEAAEPFETIIKKLGCEK